MSDQATTASGRHADPLDEHHRSRGASRGDRPAGVLVQPG